MANMSMGDRNAMERATAGNESLIRPRDGSTRGMTVFFVIALIVLAALSYAAVQAIHGWDHIVVIADIVILIGAVAFFMRNRTEPQEPTAPTSTTAGWRPTKRL